MPKKYTPKDPDSSKNNKNNARRKLLGVIATGGGISIGSQSLPKKWARPVINSVLIPAHASTSLNVATAPGTIVTTSAPGATTLAPGATTAAPITTTSVVTTLAPTTTTTIPPQLASVTTEEVNNIARTAPTGGGNVTSDGGSPVTAKGLVYSLITGPTLTDGSVSGGSGTGVFTGILLTPLVNDNDYYIKAYATNAVGTAYGNEVSFYHFYCLAKGTACLLSNGLNKNIEDINYDDELCAWNFDDGKMDTARPLWIKVAQVAPQYNLLKFSDGSKLKTISQHRIFNQEQGRFTYPMTDDTPIGTTTFNAQQQAITLVSKEIVYEPVEFYNIITDRHINLFANTILTSCRYNNIYSIEKMKFVKDNRALRPREEFLNISDEYYEGLRLAEQSFPLTEIEAYIDRLELLKENRLSDLCNNHHFTANIPSNEFDVPQL